MTALTEGQKADVILARCRDGMEDAHVVEIEGECACVWREPDLPPGLSWRGQLVSRVTDEGTVWWTGPDLGAGTKRHLVALLRAEIASLAGGAS